MALLLAGGFAFANMILLTLFWWTGHRRRAAMMTRLQMLRPAPLRRPRR